MLFIPLLLSLLQFTLSASTEPDCSYSAPGSRYFYLSNITFESHIVYSTPAHMATSSATISFEFYNSAVSYTAHCSAGSVEPWQWFNADQIYTCTVPPQGAGTATFKYRSSDGQLQANQTWLCGAQKTLGTATGHANLDCKTVDKTAENFTWPDPQGRMYRTITTTCNPGRSLPPVMQTI
ncbi:uncharacterized protein BDR25DRAFT_340541 [Lindgomyces ingoldianus]|uniref:Uncharacterized protein n=1 Tax=Lindgomyces ingoldianus TaxID=673940 RepID=A0ACB6R8Q6_9PLEO|nr:uncharacterized protein BDR25DRAFT_340541 [Lindgomyces ingoldianus]KAF2474846.1 hypothetical protein BDR25DRAFT_340541 [Lindgomyces ingoldianus]